MRSEALGRRGWHPRGDRAPGGAERSLPSRCARKDFSARSPPCDTGHPFEGSMDGPKGGCVGRRRLADVSEADSTVRRGAPHRRPLRGSLHRSAQGLPAGVDTPRDAEIRRIGARPRGRRWVQTAELDDSADGDRAGRRSARAARGAQAGGPGGGPARDPPVRGPERRSHEMGEAAGLEKDGVERHLQEELAERPAALGEGIRLVRREWPTDIGPVDLMCRDGEGGWLAVEVKRMGTIEAVEQLCRYLERIRLDPATADCRGLLVAQRFRPQAVTLAEAREIRCAEVDLELLRGEREPNSRSSPPRLASAYRADPLRMGARGRSALRGLPRRGVGRSLTRRQRTCSRC